MRRAIILISDRDGHKIRLNLNRTLSREFDCAVLSTNLHRLCARSTGCEKHKQSCNISIMFHWIATPLNYTHGKPIENRHQYGEWSITGGFALDGQLILL